MTEPENTNPVEQHRQAAPDSSGCAILTVSDTRDLKSDKSGQLIAELLESAGNRVAVRDIVADEPSAIARLVRDYAGREDVDVVLVTGGTGITSRDQTPDAISGLLTKELPGYGELLRMLSYQEIGAAAMLSRAIGGVLQQTVVLTMPGSSAAVRLAMEKVILPELGHLVSLAKS